MNTQFSVPTRDEVSPANQAIFDNLQKAIGFVPNLYATFAYSENALGRFLAYQNAKTSLNNKEKEAANLVVSQLNGCLYCSSAHTLFAKKNGFSDEQIIAIRKGGADDPKLNALVEVAASITINKGKADSALVDDFFAQGYTKENLVDLVLLVGDKTVTNYLHNLTGIPVDFPLAPTL